MIAFYYLFFFKVCLVDSAEHKVQRQRAKPYISLWGVCGFILLTHVTLLKQWHLLISVCIRYISDITVVPWCLELVGRV